MTIISKAAVGIAVGIAGIFVGYCFYFDQKRRSDLDLKQKLREQLRTMNITEDTTHHGRTQLESSGIATGKSSVSAIFREHGIPVIDADLIARKVVEPGKPAWYKIQKEFGPDMFLDTKYLDRTKLGDLIFNDIEKRKKLNAITHPDIYKEIYWQTIKYFLQGYSFIVMDLPLLFETGHMLNYLHKIIVVTCEEDLQLQRLIERSGFTEAKAKIRIAAQMSLEKKAEMANFVIENSGSVSDTREQTIKVINVLRRSKHHWKLRFLVGFCCTILLAGAYWLRNRSSRSLSSAA